jgi:ubiquitin-protein ligase
VIVALLLCQCHGESSLPKERSLPKTTIAHGNHTTTTPRNKKKKSPKSLKSSSQRQGILRIQREWRDAIKNGMAFDWMQGTPRGKTAAASHIWLGPLGSSLLIWHFSITGVPGSVFANGIYHGRIVLPPDYPSTPPRVMMLTPSGRFLPGVDICLSASHYHPETWQPNAWNLRTLVESLRLHMCTTAKEIGGLNDSYEKRLEYAQASREWTYVMEHKQQRIIIDHGRMIEKGYFPMSEERNVLEDNDDGNELDITDLPELDIDAKETFDLLLKELSGKPNRREKTEYLVIDSSKGVLHVIRRTLTSPLRMGILIFLLIFFYLNLK